MVLVPPDTRPGAVLACLQALEVDGEEGRWPARPLPLGPPLAIVQVVAIAGDPYGEAPIRRFAG